jgi:rubrerythrin
MKVNDDIEFARRSMDEESQAIGDYTMRLKACSDPELKEIFKHILKEEESHYSMFGRWLGEYNKVYRGKQYPV